NAVVTPASKSESLVPASNTPAPQSVSEKPTTTAADTQAKSRGEQLKSQLATAAQIFMSGQFGSGRSETSSATSNATDASAASSPTPAPVLKLSEASLDSSLRKNLDGLPRRVNDQFKNLGDMVNFVIVGNEKDVAAALDAANWHIADTNNKKAVLNAV